MDHARMRQVIRGLAVGWGIMTENEFDAWAVMEANDREVIFEILRKAVGYPDPEVQEAWDGLSAAWETRERLYDARDAATDPEFRQELERRAEAVSVSLLSFFPDRVRYPERADLPAVVIS